jgi:mannitol-1-/sugar-/sorbitol-6-phosphatase
MSPEWAATSSGRAWNWSGEAVLFDLDGTLVDSGASVVRAWQAVAEELSVPFNRFVPYLHGIPADQVLQTVMPSLRAAERSELAVRMNAQQADDTFDVTAIPGALAALDGLPTKRWAIVTSGDLRLATSRIKAAGLPLPRVLVTADDVCAGKPDPEPYLAAATRLGIDRSRALVVEDAVAGVESGRAAGMPVLGVLTSAETLSGVGYQVADLTEVFFEADRVGVHARSTASR